MLSSAFGSSSLIQVTVVPAGTVIVFGTKTLFTICTVTLAGVGVGDGVGDGVGLGEGVGVGLGVARLAATVARACSEAFAGVAVWCEPPELQAVASAASAHANISRAQRRVWSFL